MGGSTHFLPAAGWLLGAGLLCCLGRGVALPFPDFGIPGPVSNSAKVRTGALAISNDFNNVDEYGIELLSSYSTLAIVRDTLYSISEEVASAGKAIGTAFATLATSTGPSIDTVFNGATSAITSMEALLSTSFTEEYTTLENAIGSYVTDEFRDSFTELTGALNSLRQAVGRLKPAVEQAKTASKNSATIAPTLISKYVTPKMIQDVLDGLVRTRANIQVITYTVTNSLSKLEVADEFIIDITAEAEMQSVGVESAFEEFSIATTSVASDTSDELVEALQEGYGLETDAIALIQTELDASTDFTINFVPQLSTVDGILGTAALASFGLDINDRIADYLELLGAVDDDVTTFFSDEACLPIFELVHVLIDNGPYATFCFEKYAAQVFNLFPNFVSLASNCYADESVKLDALYVAVLPLVQLILFDVEDLSESLTTCISYPDDALCFSMISPLYETLLALTTTKRDYILQLFEHETDASVQRFSACYHAQKFRLRQVMYELETDVELCETEGPLGG
uniref:Protein TsetseEP domain-containing protein n=1 Tax=Anopheles atroparvus TaxID=41427 RepID=A0A182JIV3_ANOAO